MSLINPNPIVSSPIVSSPPGHGGSQLPDGPLNDPMGKVKGEGIQPPTVVTPKPGGSKGVPGAPGEGQAKPPTFVPDAGTHGDLNALFDGPPPIDSESQTFIGGVFSPTPDVLFETSKKSLVDDLNKQRTEVKSALTELNSIIKKSKNPAQVKEAKAKLELYNAKDKCLAGFQQLVNKFKFPSGDGFANNGQLAYAAGVFNKMHDYVLKNIVNDGPKKLDVVAIDKNLKAFTKALADLPPVDPRILPPSPGIVIGHTMAMNEGGQGGKPGPNPPAKLP